MAVADVVERVLAGEHGDFVLEAVALVTRELMEAEISQEVGAESARSRPRERPTATAMGDRRRRSAPRP
jgi:hypothetical protein